MDMEEEAEVLQEVRAVIEVAWVTQIQCLYKIQQQER